MKLSFQPITMIESRLPHSLYSYLPVHNSLLRTLMFFLTASFFLLAGSSISLAQDGALAPIASFERVPYSLFSGEHNGPTGLTGQSREVAITEIDLPEATWIRLYFEDVKLGRDSKIKITSLKDGATQILDTKALKQWGNTSAFFNGGNVQIKLIVSKNDSNVSFKVKQIHKGLLAKKSDATQSAAKTSASCTDDRVQISATSTAAEGRLILYSIAEEQNVAGCTGWIASNGAIITAGHCVDDDNDPQMVEFRVPDSDTNGDVQFSSPDHQYPINSIEEEFIFGYWDWGLLSVSPNSNTGLFPHQAQNSFYRLTHRSMSSGDPVLARGYGVNSGTQNQTLQETTGTFQQEKSGTGGGQPYVLRTSEDLYTNSNFSGSPHSESGTGLAYAIQSIWRNDFRCESEGSSFNHPELRAALRTFRFGNLSENDVFYVDDGYPSLPNVTYDGSIYGPFDTVSEAITAANNRPSGAGIVLTGDYTYGDITVSKDLTLFTTGDFTVGDITVQSGAKLTVLPGTTLKFGSGKGLTAYGQLDADGVTFTSSGSTWDGIYIYGSGADNSAITNSRVENAVNGIQAVSIYDLYFEDLVVDNSSQLGLYAMNTSFFEIYDSRIIGGSSTGVKVENGSTRITHSEVSDNNSHGIYLDNAVAFYFGGGADPGYNVVTNNGGDGIYADGSYGILGQAGTVANPDGYGGYNSIYNNTGKDVTLINSSDLDAEENWWGESTPNTSDFSISGNSSFDYTPWLGSNPNKRGSSGEMPASKVITDSEGTRGAVGNFVRWAIEVREEQGPRQAAETFTSTSNLSSSFPNLAAIFRLGDLLYLKEIEDFISLGETLLQNRFLTDREQILVAKLMFFGYLEEKKDISKAVLMRDLVASMTRDQSDTQLLDQVLGQEKAPGFKSNEIGSGDTQTTTITSYPNPFNPRTIIRYSLDKSEYVRLEVYDVLGRKVSTLVDAHQLGGTHEAVFNANHLPSGTYFYRLETANQSLTGKLLLLK